jgi:DNA repair protein RecO (recombination protein O)
MQQVVNGYVIRVNQYKEADAIVNIVTDKGEILAFKVRGMFKPKSKNNPSCQLFTKGEYVLEYKSDYAHRSLKSGTVIEQINLLEKIEPNIVLGLLAEVIILVEDLLPSQRLEMFERVFANLKSSKQYETLVLLILKYVMFASGIQLESDGCVSCGTTERINNVSFEEGGFMCADCNARLAKSPRSKEYLLAFRNVMKADFKHMDLFKIDKAEASLLINDILNYLESSVGLKFKSRVLIQDGML